MTEKEKMIKGMIYDATDKELQIRRTRAHELSRLYNSLCESDSKRSKIIDELVEDKGEYSYFQGPVFIDYGSNLHLGKYFYANFNFTVLDICPINVGDYVFCGPNVSLVNALHPMLGEERRYYINDNGNLTDKEYAKPITIGNDVWICSNVTIVGGVTIGDNVVIGAGSVVTRDIPSNSFAAGNPCKVIRPITKEDSIYLKKELF